MARAQEEHDAFAEALRARDVEVLYLTDLLTETLQDQMARNHAVTAALSGLHLGDTLRSYLAGFLHDASPEELTAVPDRRHPQRRGPRRPRPGHLAALALRLPRRPAAEPALHP